MNKEKNDTQKHRFKELEKKFNAFGEKRKSIIYTIIIAAFLFFGDFFNFYITRKLSTIWKAKFLDRK